jgi:1-aminocyclopropane-1-carboxylate deaminase/D-cysteine desulfhydrase-like pyridoxal-dependent ACC family enzyme
MCEVGTTRTSCTSGIGSKITLNKLTPVEQVGPHLYVKRDDMFTAYSGLIRGAKMRQAIQDVRYLRARCKRVTTVILSSQVDGTTGAIMAEAAMQYGLQCIICVGATTLERLHELPMMRLAMMHGARISIVAGTAYASVIKARIREMIKCAGPTHVNVEYGAWWPFGTSAQVDNLPDELDNLVIPCGTGIQMAAILYGLALNGNKRIKRVIGVRVGPDRRKEIDSRLLCAGVQSVKAQADHFTQYRVSYDLVPYAEKMNYSKPLKARIGDIELDPIYEAKAASWMLNTINAKEKTCFWIVGKRPTEAEIDAYCM